MADQQQIEIGDKVAVVAPNAWAYGETDDVRGYVHGRSMFGYRILLPKSNLLISAQRDELRLIEKAER